jgi:site-specific DNA-cytosine methylase
LLYISHFIASYHSQQFLLQLQKSIREACAIYLTDEIKQAGLQLDSILQVEHVFSCEIEPFKQAYIERNFHPPVLFRDIRELGETHAYTAYGALVPVPDNVDLLIAGTSCVDYSGLNSQKVSENKIVQ